jgi:hypothetical protein
MTSPPIRAQTSTLIVLGSFNPRIFEPLWLSSHDLVAEAEANEAERELIDKDFGRIVLPWATLVVLPDRLQIESTGETVSPSQVRDLAVGILRLLPHTPVEKVSAQHGAHVELASEERWHAVGHALAPKEIWTGILDNPGMFDIAMVGTRPDDFEGAIRVRLQPSAIVHPGLFININEEFTISDKVGFEPARQASELLEETWEDVRSRVTTIRASLLDRLIK